jgi:hypothetical protein
VHENPLTVFLVLMYVFATAIALVVVLIFMPPKTKAYPCGIAEISPDVPVKVKEQCRQERLK